MAQHNDILAAAAKAVLQPLGFRRKGRSRTWLRDHGWWLAAVEFQPSGWEKGSYLNVAAHWLWADSGFLSFDFGGHAAGFQSFASENQFAEAALSLAESAAARAEALAHTFPSREAAADVLVAHERTVPRGSWSTYHAGVAAGTVGRTDVATRLLNSITYDRLAGPADRLARLADDPAAFNLEVASLIARQRAALRLLQSRKQFTDAP